MHSAYQSTLDDILVELSVLGKLQQNGKLDTTQGLLRIQKMSNLPGVLSFLPLDGFRRMCTGDSRDATVRRLQILYAGTRHIAQTAMTNADVSTCRRLIDKITEAMKGIRNLIDTTYSTDASTQAKMGVIYENFLILYQDITVYINNDGHSDVQLRDGTVVQVDDE